MVQTFATQNTSTANLIINPQTGQYENVNDLYLDNSGNLAIATGINAVLQSCATAAKAQLGEMIYQTDQGVPNFQTLWVGVPNVQQWEVALATVLENVPGVTSVIDLSVSITNNTLTYSATILTKYGEETINGIF